MNVTTLSGWILIIFAIVYFGITLADFGPEYAAAGNIGMDAEKYGLETSETNLRFKMGTEFAIDIVIIGLIALAGWWLTTTEVIQIVWIVIIGLFTIFSIVIRSTPILPINILKLSPGAAFYGAQVQMPINKDITFRYVEEQAFRQYVVVTKKQYVNVAVSGSGSQPQAVVLDLTNTAARTAYFGAEKFPVTILGNVMGTGSYAWKNKLATVPLIKVKSVIAAPGAGG